MFEIKELTKALKQVADEKGLQPEQVLEAIEASLAAAYKKEYRERGEVIRAKLDLETGEMNFFQVKTVVAPDEVRVVEEGEEEILEAPAEEGEEPKLPRYNEERHIFLADAKKIKKDAESGEELAALPHRSQSKLSYKNCASPNANLS